ncbi:MAG: PA14 domain-containing protein [Sedimentisphaerales bacterium]
MLKTRLSILCLFCGIIPAWFAAPVCADNGLNYKYYKGSWDWLPNFEILTPKTEGQVANFYLSPRQQNDFFAFRFNGYIEVPSAGMYTFYTNSDDGSNLYIGKSLVVNNDGLHGMLEKNGSIYLLAGKHPITVTYFEKDGSENLIVSYAGPGISKRQIPDEVLFKSCLPGDLNGDGQIDLHDFAVLGQNWLNGYDIYDLEQMRSNWLKGKVNVEVKDGRYYVDGRRFFVKGIGYEPGTRPGQYPWARTFEPEVIVFDMNRIIDAGYNTIRIWSSLTEEELALIDSMGLKIVFGIWVDSAGDYGDPNFIINSENTVRNTLSYSKKYNSIIAYLIMNEPTTEQVYQGGAADLVNLWTGIKTIINEEHPGVPVSFSNTNVGDYINMNIFDMSAYNLYMYGGATVKHTLGYDGFLAYFRSLAPQNPLIVTEYGLSVSPAGPGNYGYGGNSLQEQQDGVLNMYRKLIDSGAGGGCVFTYLDGWWKNNEIPNDADTHEPDAEEWFGLCGINDANSDPNGTPRPVWYAMKQYNTAIITSPKNGQIYNTEIPLEFFLNEEVKKIKISADANILYERVVDDTYIEDTLNLNIADDKKDMNLKFEFFNNADEVLKTENIICLATTSQITLPTLQMTVPIENLNGNSVCPISIIVENNSNFVIKDNTADYAFYPHLGWDGGEERARALTFISNRAEFSDSYSIPPESVMLTVSAGVTIKYGEFEKRLYALKMIQRGNWANPICQEAIVQP